VFLGKVSLIHNGPQIKIIGGDALGTGRKLGMCFAPKSADFATEETTSLSALTNPLPLSADVFYERPLSSSLNAREILKGANQHCSVATLK